jgi:hypothetical protein
MRLAELGEAALRVSAAACAAGPLGRAYEPQARASRVSGGMVDLRRQKRKRGKATGGADDGEAGLGARFYARCGGVRATRVLSVVDAYTRDVWRSNWRRVLPPVERRACRIRSLPNAGWRERFAAITLRSLPARFLLWAVERQIELIHIQPGKPPQNTRVESFHGWFAEKGVCT